MINAGTSEVEHRERRRRRRRAGITLVEIMIVLVIIALVATGASVALLPSLEKAKKKDTIARAQVIRSAAVMYVAENPGECPSTEELVTGRFLDANKSTNDAWDKPFTIQCEGGDVSVLSGGSDGQLGTEDDPK